MTNIPKKQEDEKFKSYSMFQWSPDEAARPMILMRGSVYSHDECVKLKEELTYLLDTWGDFNVVVHNDKK